MNRLFLLLFGAVSLVAHAQVPDYVPTEGLVAWYPFNGNANDESGNGHHGEVQGAVLTTDRFGNESSAYEFDGTTRIVASGAAPIGANARTLNAFFMSDSPVPTGPSTYNIQSILGCGSGAAGPGISPLFIEGNFEGKLNTQTGSWQNMLFSENPVQDGLWHMATLTYAGPNTPVKLYLDAVLQGETDSLTLNTHSSPLYIGDAPWAVLFFDGIIDDVAVWNHALSDEAIFSLYAENPVSYGCIDSTACNFEDEATWSDGSCEYGCNYCGPGTHWVDSLLACLPSPSICGEGTVWDAELGGCIPIEATCPEDLDFDGVVGVNDLMELLSAFGTDCAPAEEPETAEWTCGDPVSYHGYDYATVQIGEQCWFAENLRNEQYANGDAIPGSFSAAEWIELTVGAQAVYDQDIQNLSSYGRLYNSFAIEDIRGLCPNQWHIPQDGDWIVAELSLGMSEAEANGTYWRGTNQGLQMKSSENDVPAWNGSNSSGFSALPGGYRDGNSGLFRNDAPSNYWSATTADDIGYPEHSYYRWFGNSQTNVYRWIYTKNGGLSVRCVKD